MQCKHFSPANHSAFSKQLKQYSVHHNEASFDTDSRDRSGEGWCNGRQRTIEITTIDIYSFLCGLLSRSIPIYPGSYAQHIHLLQMNSS